MQSRQELTEARSEETFKSYDINCLTVIKTTNAYSHLLTPSASNSCGTFIDPPSSPAPIPPRITDLKMSRLT